MKLTEIENKFFYYYDGFVELLESYKNPDQELSITFATFSDNIKNIYRFEVIQKDTGQGVLGGTFTLLDNGNVDVGVIMPDPLAIQTKLVHTSLGAQSNGLDFGYRAVKWLMKQIKGFALSQGFQVKNIVSGSRYTGARAKNNPGSDSLGLPKNFNVNKKFKESFRFDCINEELEIEKAQL